MPFQTDFVAVRRAKRRVLQKPRWLLRKEDSALAFWRLAVGKLTARCAPAWEKLAMGTPLNATESRAIDSLYRAKAMLERAETRARAKLVGRDEDIETLRRAMREWGSKI